MKSSLISVIIPAYNVAPYIRRCLDSVISQTYRDLEIILVDDGATDNTGKICDEYAVKDNRIQVIHQQNQGLSIARNSGLDIATGKWVAFLDSDDWIAPTMYEKLLTLAESNDADMSSCASIKFYEGETVETPVVNEQITIMNSDDVISGLYTQEKIRFEVWNKLWRRDLIGDVRFKRGQISEDIYFDGVIFLKINKLVYTNEPLHYYLTLRSGNIHSSFKIKRMCIFDELKEFVDNLQKKGKHELAEMIGSVALNFAIEMYLDALRSKESSNTKKEILGWYHFFFSQIKHSKFRNKKAIFLFSISPRLYLWWIDAHKI